MRFAIDYVSSRVEGKIAGLTIVIIENYSLAREMETQIDW